MSANTEKPGTDPINEAARELADHICYEECVEAHTVFGLDGANIIWQEGEPYNSIAAAMLKVVGEVEAERDSYKKAVEELIEAIRVTTRVTHGAAIAIVDHALADQQEIIKTG